MRALVKPSENDSSWVCKPPDQNLLRKAHGHEEDQAQKNRLAIKQVIDTLLEVVRLAFHEREALLVTGVERFQNNSGIDIEVEPASARLSDS